MADETTRIIRPWGRLGSRYEVSQHGLQYYYLAWIASLASLACILMLSVGLVSIHMGIGLFLASLANCCHFTWQATRHGRKLAGKPD